MTEIQNQIAQTKNQLEKLQAKAEKEQRTALKSLHKDVGFGSRQELIQALEGLGSSPKLAPKSKARNGRAKISDAIRAQIVKAAKAGKKGREIAEQFAVSLPTVQNIKKAAGLTRSYR